MPSLSEKYTLKIIGMTISLLFFSLSPVFSQEKKITIEQDTITIQQAFEFIENQSSYTIAYNQTQFDAKKIISIHVRNTEIEEVLQTVLKNTGWSYQIEKKHIILMKVKNKPVKEITQPIRGRVYDKITHSPLPFASVIIPGHSHKGVISDEQGYFEIPDLPPGRYDIKASFLGYEPFTYNEIILTSSKTPFIEIPLTESLIPLNEIIIKSKTKKDQPLNPMVLAGGQMFSVEESSRYAGGFDDPARLVTSFAGVTGGIGDNSVIIHGNAPHLLQWRLEGMEIANPNHFADMTTMGGGVFSSLSSNVLDNSDFLTGTYPAEYNNALSGIFDMKLRTGNHENYESSIEGSLIGVNIASEGPFKKHKKSSWLFNYRNATFAFIKRFIPDMEINNFGYQDLSFKLYFPYQEKSALSVWGLALLDKNYEKVERYPEEWNSKVHKMGISGDQYMASGGLIHTHTFTSGLSLKNSLGVVYTNNNLSADSIDSFAIPNLNLHNHSYQINVATEINHKVNSLYTNKSGITWSSMFYNFFYDEMHPELYQINHRKIGGHTGTLSVFSNSLFRLNERMKLNGGVNGLFFLLNHHWTLEPRLAIEYDLQRNHTLTLAYGLHSRLERLTTYFIETEEEHSNKELGFIKSHQFLLSYRWNISETKSLKIETYYHSLFNIPMITGTSYSTLNGLSLLVNVPLANEGKGINKGIDLTFERYLSNGYYYLLTSSLYDSKYCGKDKQWYNTRYNYRFLTNLLGGKEWIFGKQHQHLIGSNIKFLIRGGERYTPINEEASLHSSGLVIEENQLYKKQFAPKLRVDITLSYILNKKSTTHEFSFKALNLTGTKEYYRHRFDSETQSIVKDEVKIILPNLSYKISF